MGYSAEEEDFNNLNTIVMKIVADTNIPFIKDSLEGIGETMIVSGRDIKPELVKSSDALLVRSITKVDDKLLSGSSIKFVATATIGVDHIDTAYLESKGIGFASAPGSNANSVAEYIACALLILEKKYGKQLRGSSIGIIGAGNVGSRVEKKCRALGMKVILNDPPLARETGDAKYRPLNELYGCDFITIHTPLTKTGEDKTYHLADADFFANLKDGVFFLNSARGGVNCTNAVKDAIKSKKIAGCILDVWENEPDIDVELLELVDIASPHIAGYSYDGKVKGMMMVYEAMCRHFAIPIERNIEEFLPQPQVKCLNALGQTILEAVSKIYDITADDRDMRKILELSAAERPAYFDLLRKNYPCRREFYNTIVTKCDQANADILADLGFAVYNCSP